MSIRPTLRRLRKGIRRRHLVSLFAVALFCAGYWAFWHHHTKRFMEVREGVFYRVAQPSEFGFRYLIKSVGIKTVVSVQLYDFRLRRGLISFGDPDGCRESEYVTQLGARAVQWPMGTEKSWPWLTPWQFEQFFQLMDDPRNWPVAVHCQGGRHRTGTLAALFRLEYDRWDVERALAEMYSFKFGGAIRLQEQNLRTYLPRPHPNTREWSALRAYWSPLVARPISDYEVLVRELRAARGEKIDDALARYLDECRPFALALVQRLIDGLDDPLASRAADAAADCLESPACGAGVPPAYSEAGETPAPQCRQRSKRPEQTLAAWSMAAAIVADFGSRQQQQELLAALADEKYQQASPQRFDAVIDGVTNRYTPNRIAYLRPLLDNEAFHHRPGATGCRYCDTAVARLSAIVDENFPDVVPGWGIDVWNNGRAAARRWLDAHPAECQLSRLKAPSGQTVVERGDPPPREDLSRARL